MSAAAPPPLEVRRGVDRPHTRAEGRRTAHSFSFGMHYDPANVALGPLLAHNDDVLNPGAGYADHRHVDVEIVSWVVSGALHHSDDHGHDAVVPAGNVQVLSAGAGVMHRETAGSEPTRFVQAWLRPDAAGGSPSYAAREVRAVRGAWAPLAGGEGLALRASAARLLLGAPGSTPLTVPEAPRRHLFVLGGAVEVAGHRLGDGDALRTHGPSPLTLTAPPGDDVRLLLWLLP